MVGLPTTGSTPAMSIGGFLPIASATQLFEEQRRQAEAAQTEPLITSLSAYIGQLWTRAREAKEQTVERRMLQSLRQRRGEYDPEVLAELQQQGGSRIYMMLTSAKCRGASAWLRDVLLGQGADKPWTLDPTPVPSLPQDMVEELKQRGMQEFLLFQQLNGRPMDPLETRQLVMDLREEYLHVLTEHAKRRVAQMEDLMEDQLLEGGFISALDAFIDDITTFPAAILKGPVVRRRQKLKWTPSATGYALELTEELVKEWERVDPFMIYPSPSSMGIDDGDLFERHKLRLPDLEALIGVDGYDDAAIRAVIDEYGRGGLSEWLSVDSAKAAAEGKASTLHANPDGLIDALQFWGSIPGKLLSEWGLPEVTDTSKQYFAEVWKIGRWVIKAVLNADELGRKPYYKASWEAIPGSFWGNSICDLIRDCADMCNSAARALANNMGIASGPQVWYNVDRLPTGAKITSMYPWKIWQGTSDTFGSTAKAIEFFQPNSNAQELFQIYERFSVLADEYSNVPRYMTGDAPAGGAGRTASGMDMLLNNAGKGLKQVVSNIDVDVIVPLIDRLYYWNMRYGEDMDLKGDAQVRARGAGGALSREAVRVRRNEFLVATANPIDMQIIGLEGRATVLRETSKGLELNPDDVVPPPHKVRMLQLAQARAAQQQAMQAPQGQEQDGRPPSGKRPPGGRERLMTGAPVKDTFSPNALTPG